jgi:hypothetical protein
MRERFLAIPLAKALAGMVAAAILFFLVTASFGLFNPRDTSQPEGAVVAAALRVAHGEPLYLDVHKGPYVTAMYGPLLYALLGFLVRISGSGVEGAYLAGRLVSLLSALACAGLVGWLSRRYGASRPAAWIAGGLFLASPLILPVAYSSRSDVPALALSLAGLAWFERWSESPLRLLAALPLVAAAFTKQTALGAAAAIVFFLLISGKRARALILLAAVAAPCAAILFFLTRATGGLARVNLLEVPGASPLSLVSRPLGGLSGFLAMAALPLVLSARLLPRLLRWDRALRLPCCYLAVSLAVSAAASAKLGSDFYYFMEPLAAALILAGVSLTALLEGRHRLEDQEALLAAGVFGILLAGSVGATARMGEYAYQSNREVIRLAAAAPGDVLIEDENVALKCGKPLTMMDPFAFAYMERRGRWDAEPLNRRILDHDFGVIVLRSPVEHPSHYQGETYWPDTTLAAIGRAYRPEGIVDGYIVYRPRLEPASVARQGDRS